MPLDDRECLCPKPPGEIWWLADRCLASCSLHDAAKLPFASTKRSECVQIKLLVDLHSLAPRRWRTFGFVGRPSWEDGHVTGISAIVDFTVA